jgi:UDP-N-acetylglucosamine 2-epimerase (non-hydrolysing)
MLDEVFSDFGLSPDFTDNIFSPSQPLSLMLSKILKKSQTVISKYNPTSVIVQGDTATAFGVALSAFLLGIPVCHVEAGLRTFDFSSPFPEEYFRVSIDSFRKYLFAPDSISLNNLLNEGISKDKIFVTGNTVIDAVRELFDLTNYKRKERTAVLTLHRREITKSDIISVFSAIKRVAEIFVDLNIYYPVHPAKRIGDIAREILCDTKNIILLPPQSPKAFYSLLAASELVFTDSGGVQEEAAALGIPTLVLREKTERVYELNNGKITLVGYAQDKIISCASAMLSKDKKRKTELPRIYPCACITKILSGAF